MIFSNEFAILFHDCPHNLHRQSHWDLLLEAPSPQTPLSHPLLTFEVLSPPQSWFDGPVNVTQLPNHRSVYLSYEGTLTDNRGVVTRIAAGRLEWLLVEEDLLIARLDSSLLTTLNFEALDDMRAGAEWCCAEFKLSKIAAPNRWLLNTSIVISRPADNSDSIKDAQ